MGIGSIISGSVLLVFSLLIILVVLLQEGHQANLSGAIAGGADTFLGKNQARSVDNFLARWTKFIAIAFFVLTLVCNVFTVINK
ncbi:MAG: preprotein translocase subunit SecG [Oscillospiraceae bacterium]|jgi:preprotein translocase subunit SecG|nr:preprotein translocase subunit SecG [Oscillospiraceae bacterium]